MKPGDCVNQITGGCLMTVESIEGNTAKCQWFDDNGQLHDGDFPLSLLVKWISEQ